MLSEPPLKVRQKGAREKGQITVAHSQDRDKSNHHGPRTMGELVAFPRVPSEEEFRKFTTSFHQPLRVAPFGGRGRRRKKSGDTKPITKTERKRVKARFPTSWNASSLALQKRTGPRGNGKMSPENRSAERHQHRRVRSTREGTILKRSAAPP